MNKLEKFVKSTLGKINILSIVCAAIVVIGIVVLAVFGYSTDTTNDDVNTLTVKVNQYAYSQNLDEIEEICEELFADLAIDYEYVLNGEMSGDESEIVYVFKTNVSLKEASEKLTTAFNAATANDSGNALAGAIIDVTTNREVVPDKLPFNSLLRTVIAGVAFGVLACLYVTVRQKFTNGLTLIASMTVSAALTCALVLITRLPITASLVYVLFFNLLFTAIATMFTLNKVNAAQKENGEIEAEELISSNLAVRSVLTFACTVAVALVLVGAIATNLVRMFAIISLMSLVVGVFSSLFFAPAFYLPVKRYADKKAAQRARYDYKKGVKENKN